MKRIAILLLLLPFVLAVGCSSSSSVDASLPAQPELLVSSTSVQQIQATEGTKASKHTAALSVVGQQALDLYEKYIVHGITIGMPVSDMFLVLGKLPQSSDAFVNAVLGPTDGIFYNYEGVLIRYPDSADEIELIVAYKGSYLGLTVGKSTQADADALFGKQPEDSTVILPAEESQSGQEVITNWYFHRDGATIMVEFEKGLAKTISAKREY